MAQPTQGDVHVDALLTNISVAYIQDEKNFIAQTVFPIVPVEKQSDIYFKYTKADWFRDEAEIRADGTESAGSGYGLSTDNYRCDVWAFHKDIGDQMRANADNPLNPDRSATTFVTQRLLMRQERKWVTDFFTPTASAGTPVWATEVVGSGAANPNSYNTFTPWSDFAGSDPMEDVALAKETVLSVTGQEINTGVLSYPVYRKLKNHPDFVDRVKYTSSESITLAMMAKWFEVDRLLISKAIFNSAPEGQTANLGFLAGKHAWFGYVNPSPALEMPSAGYVFVWKGVSDGLGTNIGITRFRMQNIKSDRVEGEIAWANKVVASDCGYLFDYCVA